MIEKGVLLVDDHPAIRDGLRTILENHPSKYKYIVYQAATGEEGVAKAIKVNYDVIIMDYQLPGINGCSAAAEIIKNKPYSIILGMSGYYEGHVIKEMIESGVKGFCSKKTESTEWIRCLEALLDGKDYYPADVRVMLRNLDNAIKSPIIIEGTTEHLTSREIQILEYRLNHFSNENIANELHISKSTVEKHISNMIRKFQAENHFHLLRLAKSYLKNVTRENC